MAVPDVPGYRVREQLGEGSAGTVWSAIRTRDLRPVAIKVVTLAVSHAGVDAGADQAAREYGLLQGLVAEHVVPFHEAVVLPGDVAALAIVLELMDGGSLRSVVAARGHLNPGEAVTVLSPISRALAGLHAQGVLHSDVSPGNVLLDRTGRPVLGDLGVARLVGEACAAHGTEGFVAPEVELGGSPSAASDVYAVGALAWFCLTGTVPGPSAFRPSLAEAVPGLPGEFQDAVVSCLDIDPARRPTAAEAALAIYDSAAAQPIRLVAGPDDVSGLTRRIRAGAHAADDSRPAGQPGRHGRGRRRDLVPRPKLPRVPAAAGTLRLGRLPLRATGGLAVVAALAVVAVLGWPRLASAWGDASTGSTRSILPTTTRHAAVSTPERATKAQHEDVRRGRNTPLLQTKALMASFADARSRVWNNAVALTEVDAPGSAALRTDTALLQRVHQAGQRYAGVRFTVRSAHASSSAATEARVVAEVDTTAYVVLGAHGQAQRRPAVRGAPLTFHLIWTAQGWRIGEVSAAPATS